MIRIQSEKAKAMARDVLAAEWSEFDALIGACEATFGVAEIGYEGPAEIELRELLEANRRAEIAKVRELLK